jgi:hypothetical protein
MNHLEDTNMKTTLINSLLPVTLAWISITLMLNPGLAIAGDWQEKLLFNPSESQLKAERRGRIMIYDGLKDTEIRKAMDTQFDRIESMMFVRTVVTNEEGNVERDSESGQVVVEDDGC